MKVLKLTQFQTNRSILLKADSFVVAIDHGSKREVFYHLIEGIRLSYDVEESLFDIECQLKGES